MVAISKNMSVHSSAPKNEKNVKGTLLGLGAGSLAKSTVNLANKLSVNAIQKFSAQLSQDEVQIANKVADDILSTVTNLEKKGVSIDNWNEPPEIKGFLEKLIKKRTPAYTINTGKNAQFIGKNLIGQIDNTIYINRDKLPLATFHEIGHAFNYNNSKFWRSIQGLRMPSMFLAALFTYLPLFTKDEKAQEGQELTKGQKFKNGLRKASPLLAFASMVPVLAEEVMASFRGCKWAKQLLDKNLYKKVLKTNIAGFASYLAGAVGLSAFAFVAKKVKDHFANNNKK